LVFNGVNGCYYLPARATISAANPIRAQANSRLAPREVRPAKQVDGMRLLGYLGNVNRNLNPNLLLNALRLRRAAVGF